MVAGQDVEIGDDGVFRIAHNVARDRVISTVDPEARHGHKSRNRRFDGYKAHVSVDPDSELIDDVVVTPANTHDGAPRSSDLLADHADADDKPTVMGDSAESMTSKSSTNESTSSTKVRAVRASRVTGGRVLSGVIDLAPCRRQVGQQRGAGGVPRCRPTPVHVYQERAVT